MLPVKVTVDAYVPGNAFAVYVISNVFVTSKVPRPVLTAAL